MLRTTAKTKQTTRVSQDLRGRLLSVKDLTGVRRFVRLCKSLSPLSIDGVARGNIFSNVVYERICCCFC